MYFAFHVIRLITTITHWSHQTIARSLAVGAVSFQKMRAHTKTKLKAFFFSRNTSHLRLMLIGSWQIHVTKHNSVNSQHSALKFHDNVNNYNAEDRGLSLVTMMSGKLCKSHKDIQEQELTGLAKRYYSQKEANSKHRTENKN